MYAIVSELKYFFLSPWNMETVVTGALYRVTICTIIEHGDRNSMGKSKNILSVAIIDTDR